MPRPYRFLSFFLAPLLPTAAVAADVLTKENETFLCRGEDGQRTVDVRRLAQIIVAEAGIPDVLIDGVTGNLNDGVTYDEILFVVRNTSAPFFQVDYADPFISAKRDALIDIVESLNRVIADPQADGLYVRLPEGEDAGRTTALVFFENPPRMLIACIGEAPPATAPAREETRAGTLPGWLRIRGEIEDLSAKPSDLPGEAAFQIGLFEDLHSDSREFSVDGVVGIALGGEAGYVNYAPYLQVNWNEFSDDAETDVGALTPGFLLEFSGLNLYEVRTPSNDFGNGNIISDMGLSVALTEDIEQDARKGVLSAFLQPSITTSAGQLFGTYLDPFGPFYFRPELTLLSEAAWIFADGESPELADAQNYIGLGGDLSVKLRVPGVPLLSNFTGEVGVRDLRFIAGDINSDSARRWRAAFRYNPPNFPYVALQLSYEDGDNIATFQNEKFYRFGVGIQY